LILLYLCSFTFASSVFASNDDVDNIFVTTEEWEGYTNKNGTGVYWDIIKKVYEPLGIHVNTKLLPWKRAEAVVLNKQADALLGAYYQQDNELLYPKWHISIEDPLVIIFGTSNIQKGDKLHILSFKDKKIGWIRGYGFEKTLFKDIPIEKKELSRMQSGLLMLKAGRLDALVDYESNIEPLAQKMGLKLGQSYTTKELEKGNKLFLAFSKTNRSKKLIKLFDERMEKLVASGEIEKIYLKWGHSKKKFSKERYSKD